MVTIDPAGPSGQVAIGDIEHLLVVRVNENTRVLGLSGGAVGLSAFALALGACCVAPWAVALLGVAGAVFLARLAFLQPHVVAATLALVAVLLWLVYRAPRADPACVPATRRRQRLIVWIAALIVVALDVASFAPRFLS